MMFVMVLGMAWCAVMQESPYRTPDDDDYPTEKRERDMHPVSGRVIHLDFEPRNVDAWYDPQYSGPGSYYGYGGDPGCVVTADVPRAEWKKANIPLAQRIWWDFQQAQWLARHGQKRQLILPSQPLQQPPLPVGSINRKEALP